MTQQSETQERLSMTITDEIELDRIRKKWGKEGTSTATEIRFLLSLIDSQTKLARELALIVDVGTSDDPGTALMKIRKLQSDAATQMRHACVEKVRAIRDDYIATAAAMRDDEQVGLFSGHAGVANEIVEKLSSLTLEVKQK